jgi:hypothetical protein
LETRSENELALEDENKQMAQYIEELEDEILRLQSELKTTQVKGLRIPRRSLPRSVIATNNGLTLEGAGINVSTSGICIEVKSSIIFDVFINEESGEQKGPIKAELMWARKLDDERVRLGLHFDHPESFAIPLASPFKL